MTVTFYSLSFKVEGLGLLSLEAESLIKMARSRKSAEYQAKEKAKSQTSIIPQNPHVHSLIEINVLWECKSKYVRNVTQNDIERFFALGGKAACRVSGKHEISCIRTCPLSG